MSAPAVIQLRNLVKTYLTGEVEVKAVGGVDLEIRKGEWVAIMGASGSGKSTLMNILGCLDRPTSGTYHIDGIEAASLNRRQLAAIRNEKLGFVFQNFNLLTRTTAAENVELPLFYGHSLVARGERRQRVLRALQTVGLGNRLGHTSTQLSGGQQQRVAIARALVNEPTLLLADEPTGNLDSRTSAEIMGLFQALNDSGITVVMVTHEPDIAAACKRIVVMRDGKIVSDEVNLHRQEIPRQSPLALPTKKPPPRRLAVLSAIQSYGVRTGLTATTALRSLRRNKLRSGLTALGIIIGVASVVAMVAVGNGAQASIEARIAALGQNLLTVFAGSRRSLGVNSGLGSASTLTLADAAAIRREVADVVAVSPEVSASEQAIANGRNWSTTIAGESPDYLSIRDWKLAEGVMFTDRDVRSASKVAVIGSKAAHELFGPIDPLFQTVRVGNIPFVITGLLSSKGAGMGGVNQDDRLVIPYTTAMKRLTGDRYLRSVNVQIAGADRMEGAEQQISRLLRQRHRLEAGKEDDFNILSQKEIADTVGTVTQIVTLLLGAVSGISLVVGGIGIMNIMLVSVTERTREIGIRIAVGAKPADIQLQFLIEAVTLSLLGGILGVLGGLGAARIVAAVANFEAIVSPASIALAFGVSGFIGVFFGYYPARRAAALDPIEALRYE
jgi:macrolide transport system ATP-binding/permease protein